VVVGSDVVVGGSGVAAEGVVVVAIVVVVPCGRSSATGGHPVWQSTWFGKSSGVGGQHLL